MSKLVLILLERPFRLTETQLDKLSDILINIGILFFGAMVVPFFISGVDKPRLWMLILGLGLSSILWFLVLFSVRRVNYHEL